jgi:hypothetical protein
MSPFNSTCPLYLMRKQCQITSIPTRLSSNGNMIQLREKLETCETVAGYYAFTVVKQKNHYSLQCLDGMCIGILNSQTAAVFNSALSEFPLDFEAFLKSSDCYRVMQRARKASDADVFANINIYGHKSLCKVVGAKFSTARMYFQHPTHRKDEHLYENPHYISFPGLDDKEIADLRSSTSVVGTNDTAESMHKMVSGVYQSLRRGEREHGLECDVRIKTPLLL